MRRLASPARDERTDFDSIAGRRSPLTIRELVLNASTVVYAAYDRYGEFYGVDAISIDTSIVGREDPLAPALRGNFRALNTGARYASMRGDILSAADIDNQVCPYCLVNSVGGAIDHVVPKGSHAEFSVLHLNLAPICDECNRLKGIEGPMTNRAFLHPYYAQLPAAPFVSASVTIVNYSPRFQYVLCRPTSMAADWFKAAMDHFEVLQLARRWGDAAVRDYADYADYLHQAYLESGISGVRKTCIDFSKSSSRKFGSSYWRSILWGSLAASDEFCSGGFVE